MHASCTLCTHAGTVDYSRFEMLAKDLPEDEEADLSDEDLY
jgi:hypothetical protein